MHIQIDFNINDVFLLKELVINNYINHEAVITHSCNSAAFSTLTLLAGQQQGSWPVTTQCRDADMVICEVHTCMWPR